MSGLAASSKWKERETRIEGDADWSRLEIRPEVAKLMCTLESLGKLCKCPQPRLQVDPSLPYLGLEGSQVMAMFRCS